MKVSRVLSLIVGDFFVVIVNQVGIDEDGKQSHSMFSSFLHLRSNRNRVAHDGKVFEWGKHDGNSEDKASREFDLAFVGVEKLQRWVGREGLHVHANIPVDDQRLEALEAAKKPEVFDAVHRQIDVRDVISKKLDQGSRKLVHSFERKRNFPVYDFIHNQIFVASTESREWN